MSEAVQFRLEDGSPVLFEVSEEASGIGRVSRGTDGVVEATRSLEDALDSVRRAASASLRVLQTLRPDKLEFEFGVKLTAEAGALIARTAGEGHFVVKVSWEAEDIAQAD